MPFNPYGQFNPYQQQYGSFQQPYLPPQQTPQQQPQTNLYAFVNGVEGAKSYQVPAGSSVMLMDSEQPLCYMKQANAMGQASIRYFKLTEVDESTARGKQAQAQVDYVSRSEFDELAKKVNGLMPKQEQ